MRASLAFLFHAKQKEIGFVTLATSRVSLGARLLILAFKCTITTAHELILDLSLHVKLIILSGRTQILNQKLSCHPSARVSNACDLLIKNPKLDILPKRQKLKISEFISLGYLFTTESISAGPL